LQDVVALHGKQKLEDDDGDLIFFRGY